ncbi:MAG: hypothetical protein ABIA63_02715, partial [bacterium]
MKSLCLNNLTRKHSEKAIEKQIFLLDSCIALHTVKSGQAYLEKYRLDKKLSEHFRPNTDSNAEEMKCRLLGLAYKERGIENLIMGQRMLCATDSSHNISYNTIKRELKSLMAMKKSLIVFLKNSPLPSSIKTGSLEEIFYNYEIDKTLMSQAIRFANLYSSIACSDSIRAFKKLKTSLTGKKAEKYLLTQTEYLVDIQNTHFRLLKKHENGDNESIDAVLEIAENLSEMRRKLFLLL